jgi:hypothetical protein
MLDLNCKKWRWIEYSPHRYLQGFRLRNRVVKMWVAHQLKV